jgi:hypothetical protein
VRAYIEKMRITTRSVLMRKFFRDLDPQTLAQAEETLKQAGMISISLDPKVADKMYKWIGDRNDGE